LLETSVNAHRLPQWAHDLVDNPRDELAARGFNFAQASGLATQRAQVIQLGAILSMTLELMGKMRSTPWPKLILRTVKLGCAPLLRAMTIPSKA
jgi:hypothetical protein